MKTFLVFIVMVFLSGIVITACFVDEPPVVVQQPANPQVVEAQQRGQTARHLADIQFQREQMQHQMQQLQLQLDQAQAAQNAEVEAETREQLRLAQERADALAAQAMVAEAQVTADVADVEQQGKTSRYHALMWLFGGLGFCFLIGAVVYLVLQHRGRQVATEARLEHERLDLGSKVQRNENVR